MKKKVVKNVILKTYCSFWIIENCFVAALFTLLHVGNFPCFCCLQTFGKMNFFKNDSLRSTLTVSNSLDPDQNWYPVGPGLGSNYLQRLSAGDKIYHKQLRKELKVVWDGVLLKINRQLVWFF